MIDWLKTYYGIEAVTLTRLPLGADMDASVYKADAQDGKSYFVKLKRDLNMDVSLDVVKLLQHAGIKQIIFPIKTIQGQLSFRKNGSVLVVYPFIAGQNGFTQTLKNDQWRILGKTLKQIHEIKISFSMQQRLREETFSSKWRDIVRYLIRDIGSKSVDDELALKLLTFMRFNKAALERLVIRAEQLASNIQNKSYKLVLCHSDIHGGNLLIDKNNAIYIVDWDEPMMAPKERDLMFIGGGVGNVWNQANEEALFYEGYGKADIDGELLTYYRYERIVEDIALMVPPLFLTTTDKAERSKIYKFFIDMFEPKGVVAIAFETDDKYLN